MGTKSSGRGSFELAHKYLYEVADHQKFFACNIFDATGGE